MPPVAVLKESDIELITKACFPQIDDACMDMIWQCSQANGRELQKLIVKLQAYKSNQGDFNPDIISRIYHGVVEAKSAGWTNQQLRA